MIAFRPCSHSLKYENSGVSDDFARLGLGHSRYQPQFAPLDVAYTLAIRLFDLRIASEAASVIGKLSILALLTCWSAAR